MSNTYPKSIITLYNAQELVENKNMIVDELETLLQDKQQVTYECQYIKHGLGINVKLALPEEFQTKCLYTYCKVVNYTAEDDPERTIYYFIEDINVKAQNTIELLLVQDVLNTYKYDWNWGVDTHITRQHKDRFDIDGYDDIAHLPIKVDRLSEGISSPIKDVIQNEKVDNYYDPQDHKWYLVYYSNQEITQDAPISSIETYLCADDYLDTKYPVTEPTKLDNNVCIYYNDVSLEKKFLIGEKEFEFNKLYYFKKENSFQKKFNGLILAVGIRTTRIKNKDYDIPMLLVRNIETASTQLISYVDYTKSNNTLYFHVEGEERPIPEGLNEDLINKTSSYRNGPIVNNESTILSYTSIPYTPTSFDEFKTSVLSIDIKKNIQVNKIVELPYCPVAINTEYDAVTGKYTYILEQPFTPVKADGLFKGFYKLDSIELTDLITTGFSKIDLSDTLLKDLSNKNKVDYKDIELESKLKHSDFYNSMIYYDTSQITINLEDIDYINNTGDRSPIFNIDYSISKSFAEGINFKIDDGSDNWKLKTNERFPYMMNSVRNNAVTIYNSAFLEYMQNGYNYDKKQKSIDTFNAISGSIVNGIQTAAIGSSQAFLGSGNLFNEIKQEQAENRIGVAPNPLFSGPPKKYTATTKGVLTVASGALGVYKAVSGAISSVQSINNSYQAKLTGLQGQTINAATSNELSLLHFYSDNKLFYCVSEVDELIKEKLFELFFKYGYINDEYGIPNTETRQWFNFVQCEPVFTYSNHLDRELRDAIVYKFSQGVTYFHNYNGQYDFDYQHENWEEWLLPYLND